MSFSHQFVDRHGRPRYYFRHQGKRWPLPAPTDPTFLEQYKAYKTQVVDQRAKSNARVVYLPGQLGWAIAKFLESPEFESRAEGTKAADRRIFDTLRERFGGALLREMQPSDVKKIRNEMRHDFATSTADRAVSLISVVWDWVDEHTDIELPGANPKHGIKKVHRTVREHEPWPDDLIGKFDAVAPPKLALLRLLAFYTGQRRSDLVMMRWSDIKEDGILVKQQKTDEPLTIPIHQRLMEALESAPHTSDFIIPSHRNKPFTPEGLSNAVRKILKRLGVNGYSVHGWRKNAGVAMAEVGCSEFQIAAVLGHKSLQMVAHYTKRASQKKRAKAAMEKWEGVESGKPANKVVL